MRHKGIRMMTYALEVFAAVFFVVGIFRVVEFKAAGISGFQRAFLIPLHIIGCGLFTACIVLLAIDPAQEHKKMMVWFFFSAILLLFPIHIYVGLKRRIRMSK
jgi:phosphate starvation-inducible membrane PsiE